MMTLATLNIRQPGTESRNQTTYMRILVLFQHEETPLVEAFG